MEDVAVWVPEVCGFIAIEILIVNNFTLFSFGEVDLQTK
jgi:hypothetical protein